MSDRAPLIDRKFASRVDWNLMRTFVDIVRAGGIGAAARQLNRQQPSISAALKRLEDHVGASLLVRTATGVEMTPAGKAMMALCEDMLETARMVPHQIAQATRRVDGFVRIQIVSGLVSAEFDEAIASFHRRNPAIHIEIRVSPWRQVLDALEQGEVEIGVGYDGSVRGSLTYEPLLVERQQLYCSRSSPYFGYRVSRLHELKDEGFVLTGDDEIELITNLRRRYRLGSNVGGMAEDINEARRLIKLGVGIGFLPVPAAEAEVARGTLWPMLHADFEPSYDVYLLARAEPARDTATQLFWDEVFRRVRASSRA
ncbi:transcriptional regulator, LysR family [Novosphingobium aromaticivorans DSM 12444]|uniref:Transcriptional regulator, LysR family n=1 Tax=Novosphingobium aromaticivorans (strain ATCC 700278 / DSM 12444 / CCUG 56034 / CIP 105152 / NBRC 16084 / F199) TaxID=279238 RepID=Q2GAS7_NOVAD|nr:LysR family transcriptional regulator [Novosphingobium aromaticivorans]ABD25046.1 transcriptional regulator, LysR family [Novosphingobium aromaticivorans DSM 12444]SCY87211.1 transcriptional regulator, LysR family [Novosphingobium aromaticivorans]